MPTLAVEVAAAAAQEFAPIVLGWITQAIAGGKMTPAEAEALWTQSKGEWDSAFAAWNSSK